MSGLEYLQTIERGEAICEGNIIHRGGRAATAEAKLTEEAGTL
jgi:acyl-coenzyme A thioesterase PaaI-like protein